MQNIIVVNERYYQCEDGSQFPIKAVLVMGFDKLCRGYIASGSDHFVADHGAKMTFTEARVHFPNIEEKDYSFR